MSKSGIRARTRPGARRAFTLALVVTAIVGIVGVGTSAAMRLAVADAGAGDRLGRHRQRRPVLRHEADHARGARRLRHQRVVAGVVRGRPLRGGEVHERQGDHGRRRRRPAEVDLRHQLVGRAGRERDHGDPRLRLSRAARDPAGNGGRASRSCRGAPTRAAVNGKDFVGYVDWNAGYAGHDVGAVDGQGAARQGQRHLHRRPGG